MIYGTSLQNSYLRGALPDSAGGFGDLKAIANLPEVKIQTDTKVSKTGSKWMLTTTLNNNTKYPAFNIRLKVIGDKSGNRILPVVYDDNYFTLLPGEKRVIKMELKDEDTRGEKPMVVTEGFNVE